MPAVSVIIPVYNTAPWLRRCFDSVVGQTLREIEIIAVNDGSTDNSLEILREYAAADSRVKIIDLAKNSGAAAARNAGIDAATGEYLGFVDSDDYIDLDFYEKLYRKATECNAEVAKGVIKTVDVEGQTTENSLNDEIKINKANFNLQYTSAVYATSFIKDNKIYFPAQLTNGEDCVFSCKVALLCNKIEIINGVYYYYIKRLGSADDKFLTMEKTVSCIKMMELIIDFINNKKIRCDEYIIIFTKNIFFLLIDYLLKKINRIEIRWFAVEEVFRLLDQCKKEYRCEIVTTIINRDEKIASYLLTHNSESFFYYFEDKERADLVRQNADLVRQNADLVRQNADLVRQKNKLAVLCIRKNNLGKGATNYETNA